MSNLIMNSPNQISIVGRWYPFYGPADISILCLKLNSNGHWTLHDELTHKKFKVPADKIRKLINALNDPSPMPDPIRLNRNAELLDQHYFRTCWTNDSPELLVELKNDSQVQHILTKSQKSQLLPWTINIKESIKSFNPDISTSLADILPENWMYTERLRKSSIQSDQEFEEEQKERKKRFTESDSSEKPGKSYEEQMADLDSAVNELLEKKMMGEKVEYTTEKLDYTANQIRTMSLPELTSLVEQGFDLSTSDETGQTALILAASPPFDQEQFDNLVSAGADVNARRADQATGLMIACAGWEDKTALHWVDAGADVNLKGPNNCTALMLGTRRFNTVRHLLDHGADPALKDSDGDTALDYAIEKPDVYHAGERLNTIALLSELIGRTDLKSVKRSLERAIQSAHQERIRKQVENRFSSVLYPDSKKSLNQFEYIKKYTPERMGFH